jgi:hypothetical protein
VILGIRNGLKGGSPTNPTFVSQLRFNYLELYGPKSRVPHAVFRLRYKQKVWK